MDPAHMAVQLARKTAVITAAAQGIGQAAPLAFARERADVWATDLHAPQVKVPAGTTATPSLQGRISAQADPVQARKDFTARQPMGRLRTVEDMTGIMVYLASDESLFAPGNVFSIDGGMTI